jgi:hypothetical protein
MAKFTVHTYIQQLQANIPSTKDSHLPGLGHRVHMICGRHMQVPAYTISPPSLLTIMFLATDTAERTATCTAGRQSPCRSYPHTQS